MADKIKFALALVLLAAGVAGFYLLSEQAMILRVLAVLAGVAVAIAVAWKTEPGQRFFVFAQESVTETKKVVWPSRKETMVTTGLVFAMAAVTAIFFFVVDQVIGLGVRALFGLSV